MHEWFGVGMIMKALQLLTTEFYKKMKSTAVFIQRTVCTELWKLLYY